MKLNNKFLNLLFYTLIVFGLFTFVINSGLDIELKIYNYYYFIAAIFLKIINFFIFNQVHYHIFNIFSLKIGISENFDLTYKGYIGNFFGFGKSGTGYKAIFLKNKYQFSYIKFLSFYILLQTVTIISTAFFCLLILFLSSDYQINENTNLILVLISIIIFSIASNLIYKIFTNIRFLSKNKYLQNLVHTYEEIALISDKFSFKDKNFIKVIFYQIFIQLNLFAQILMLSQSLNIDLKILSNFVYNIISQLSTFVSITPNSIGLKEFILVISDQFIGLTNSQILNIAILDRLSDFISLAVFSLIFYFVKTLFMNKGDEVED